MSKKNKYLLGAAGAAGAGVMALRTFLPWLSDDLKFIATSLRLMKVIAKDLNTRTLIIDVFEEHAAKTPNKPFIIFEDKIYSYQFVNEMANRVANFAISLNLKMGDTVAVMMTNEPAFIWTYLGLQKIGIIAAFINYHLKAKPLAHSVKSSEANVLILGNGNDFLEAIQEVKDELPNIPIYVQGKSTSELPSEYLSFDEALRRSLPVPVSRALRAEITLSSTLCYIYTSGTTGLPKPAIFTIQKGITGIRIWQLINMKPEDIVYIVTPLYHSAATCISLHNAIGFGATVVLKRKFSAKEFFSDCRKHDVTIIQYIGELCRYLLHQPESELDGVHKIRVAFGNGLRPDIWETFQKRFKIPWIVEFFASTEGTGGFGNFLNKPGAVGRFSPLAKWIDQQALVKYDPNTEQPLRDKNGHCIKINAGEEGLVISPIPPGHSGFYKGPKEMDEKKIIRNAFKEGDIYFNYGDLLYLDKDYFLYFRDRLGDTFRWKGENVSTMEVGHVLTGLSFIRDVNVYGVTVPGHDGRAGMAAILLKEKQEVTSEILKQIYDYCHHNLASYSKPLFLRFVKEIPLTQTMKHRKVDYVKEGFDPSKVPEPLFYLDQSKKTYTPLDSTSLNTMLSSKL